MFDIPVNRDTLKALKIMGLTDYESRTYLALTSIISGTATEVSKVSEVPRSKIYQVLKSLEKKGFIDISRGKPLKFNVIPPKEVFENSRKEIRDSMVNAEAELNVIYENHITNVPAPIWLIHGQDKLVKKEIEIISRAKESLFVMGGFMFEGEPMKLKESLEASVKKGVATSIITVPYCMIDGKQVNVPDEVNFQGLDIKVLSIPHIKMVLRDKKEMLISFCRFQGENVLPDTSIGIWNQYQEFVETISGIYEFIWENELFNRVMDP